MHEHREHRVWQKVPGALPVCSARSNGERAARNSDEQIANVVQVDQKRGENGQGRQPLLHRLVYMLREAWTLYDGFVYFQGHQPYSGQGVTISDLLASSIIFTLCISLIHVGHLSKVLAISGGFKPKQEAKHDIWERSSGIVEISGRKRGFPDICDRHNRGTTGDTQYVASVLLCGVFAVHGYAYWLLEILASRTTITLVVLTSDRSSE
ncbi:hypothetical protein HZH68_008318 [Vespula germanica]|uniref:Uncharacterized protein n=1 Tax=Vespula germanica TaxID=30212 RepID=A0A834K471_VESGE|nr:hypothetical protein HZH68_008318 [Vespula germanica]